MENKREMTAPNVSVGADTEQPIQKCTDHSISDYDENIKSFEEMQREMLRQLSPSYLNYDKGLKELSDLETALDTSPKYQLPEPQGFMTAKAYKTKMAEPLVKRLKSLIKTVLARCYEGWDNYYRLNTTNRNLYQSNEWLKNRNRQLTTDNNRLREEIKDYKLLRKVFGSRQIDSLLEQARQSKQRGTRFRNNQYER